MITAGGTSNLTNLTKSLHLSGSQFLHLIAYSTGKPEGKRPLWRLRRRWEDNIKMGLQEVGCGGADWITLAQDRDSWRALMTAVMNLRVPKNEGNLLTSLRPVSFSRRTLLHGISK